MSCSVTTKGSGNTSFDCWVALFLVLGGRGSCFATRKGREKTSFVVGSLCWSSCHVLVALEFSPLLGGVGTIPMSQQCDWLTGPVQNAWSMFLGREGRADRYGMNLCLC